jgi:hypothetical protein
MSWLPITAQPHDEARPAVAAGGVRFHSARKPPTAVNAATRARIRSPLPFFMVPAVL